MATTAIGFDSITDEISNRSDDEFLQSIRWNREAPRPLADAARAGDFEKYTRLLKAKNCVVSCENDLKKATTFSAKKTSLWSRATFEDSPRTSALAEIRVALQDAAKYVSPRKKRKATKKNRIEWNAAEAELLEWLKSADPDVPLPPLEMLLVNEMLLAVGPQLSDAAAWRLWRTALTASMMLAEQLPEPAGSWATDEQRAVIEGELPFQAGLLFSGIKGGTQLRKQGAKFLTNDLLEATDSDGTPHAGRIERLTVWLAPLVRAKRWAAAFDATLFTAAADERFHKMLRVVAPMCRADDRIALGNGLETPAARILRTATQSAGFAKNSAPMRYLSAVRQHAAKTGPSKRPSLGTSSSAKSTKLTKKKRRKNLPVIQSDWAQLACLRNDWSLAADTILVAHDRKMPRVDFSAAGVPLIAGTWGLELSLDGKTVDVSGDWACTCWYSDEDADYIELQNSLDNGVVIDRQILLSRTDHFALFADSVSAGTDANIEYAQRLPCLDDVAFHADVPTRECGLNRNGITARAFPLSLASDRVRSTPGSFAGEDGFLELRQTAVGGLYAPILLDWSPKRKRAHAEWARLTVAEDGNRLTSADASAHRLRLGNQHLFVYRSLTKGHFARSALGHHTAHETVIGRFKKSGNVDPLVLVD